jgi:hypothetical protein
MITARTFWGVALPLMLLVAMGCGEDSPTSSSELSPGDRAARENLLIAYRAAETARRDRVQCKVDPAVECDPLAYPPPDVLVPEIGSARLHQLLMRSADTTDDVVDPKGTYVVAEDTTGHALVLADRTPEGTVWVLRGSPSGHEISRAD